MLDQESLMSPVVRHRCPPTWSPQPSHGLFSPHSHSANTIGRPVLRSASDMAWYRSTAGRPWLLQLSYLR